MTTEALVKDTDGLPHPRPAYRASLTNYGSCMITTDTPVPARDQHKQRVHWQHLQADAALALHCLLELLEH